MARTRGFTLIELMTVVGILAVLATLVVYQGRSARQNADLAGGVYDLALRVQGLKGRAIADGRDYLLVVVDAADRVACANDRTRCAQLFQLRSPTAAFNVAGFDPAAPAANAEYDDSQFLPRGAVLDVGSAWTPPAPFNTVAAWNPAIRSACSGRTCFALRFTASGQVLPEPPAPLTPTPAGFTFVVSPVAADTASSDRRALFVSFPAGIVKTAAF